MVFPFANESRMASRRYRTLGSIVYPGSLGALARAALIGVTSAGVQGPKMTASPFTAQASARPERRNK